MKDHDTLTKRERKRLTKMLIAHLETLGARKENEHTYEDMGKFTGETSYLYVLDTPAGAMDVRFATHGSHLHCKFHEPERAVGRLETTLLNQHSGKYNVYHQGTRTAEDAMEIFKAHLRKALEA